MTRAFGDARVKDHITVEPSVTIEKIDRDTDCIILASDGLWKVIYSASSTFSKHDESGKNHGGTYFSSVRCWIT